jgi:hypothetical protein
MEPVADENEESFRVQPARDFEYDLCDIDRPDPGQLAPTRDLDLELEGFGLDDVAPVPPPKAEAGQWTLDEKDPGGSAGATAPRAAQAAPAQTAAPAPQKAQAEGSVLSLRLDVSGLPEGLRRALAALEGRRIELPPLVLRLRSDDRGGS